MFFCILNDDGRERQWEEREAEEIKKGFNLNIPESGTSQ
jgi:hypothetical protein